MSPRSGPEWGVARRAERTARCALGPWPWPDTETERADWADRLDLPEPARWGALLLTAIEPTGGALLVAETGRSAAPRPATSPRRRRALAWGPEAERAWGEALRVLPLSVPLLWRSVQAVARPEVTPLAWHTADRPDTVDGASLGLPFALLVGAEVLGLQLPADLAATGALAGDGRVVQVEGVAQKVQSIQMFAPSARRLMVSSAQRDAVAQAVEASGAVHLEVIGVATVAEAVSVAFGGDLAAALVQAGETAEARAELAESFFELALDRHHAVPSWGPVAEAAALALGQWTEASPAERFRLAFARAVAARHAGRAGSAAHPLPLPDAAARASLPIETRTLVLAHLVQQSHDHGVPPPLEALEVAAPLAATDLEAWPAQIRLAGAVGRLRALVGDAAAGLAAARAAAEAWAVRRAWGEVSYPLCEWYRLAGAVGDAAAFEAAQALHHRAAEGIGVHGLRFVQLAEARARVCLLAPGAVGAEAETARTLLDALLGDADAPGLLRPATARWRARLALMCGEAVPPEVAAGLATDPVQHALHTLDAALLAVGALAPSALAPSALAPSALGPSTLAPSALAPSAPGSTADPQAPREATADADPAVHEAFGVLWTVAPLAQALPVLLVRGLSAAAVARMYPY